MHSLFNLSALLYLFFLKQIEVIKISCWVCCDSHNEKTFTCTFIPLYIYKMCQQINVHEIWQKKVLL